MILGIIASGITKSKQVTGSYESIATATPNNAATVSFTSIPTDGTYNHLQLRFIGRSTTNTGTDTYLKITFNSDTATNYSYHGLYGNGSNAYGDIAGTSTAFIIGYDVVRAAVGANYFGAGVMDVLDYANGNKYKTTRLLGGMDINGTGFISLISGNWRSTSAINRIDISLGSGNWDNYSHIALYGIKA